MTASKEGAKHSPRAETASQLRRHERCVKIKAPVKSWSPSRNSARPKVAGRLKVDKVPQWCE